MYASVNDTRLYFDVDGAQLRVGSGNIVTVPAVVALHGGPGFDQGYLRPGLGPLHDRAQIVFPDLRGQGRSDPVPADTCTLEQMADDVIALCSHLGIERPILLGHSAGGFVALHAALRHPDAVGALILSNTAATLAPEVDPGVPSLAERGGTEAAQVATRLFGGDLSAETGEAFARIVAPYYAAPGHEDVPNQLFPLSRRATDVMRFFFSGPAADYDLRSQLPQIQIPTLVIAGGYDWVCPPAASRILSESIPGSQLHVVANAGHFPMSEEPQQFHQMLGTFLTSLQAAAAVPGG
jgi:proline iminopeptidase